MNFILESAQNILNLPSETSAIFEGEQAEKIMSDVWILESFAFGAFLSSLIGREVSPEKFEEALIGITMPLNDYFVTLFVENKGLSLSETKELARRLVSAQPLIESGKKNVIDIVSEYIKELTEYSQKNVVPSIIECITNTPEMRDKYLVETNNDISKASEQIAETAHIASVVGILSLGAPELKMILESCKRKKKNNNNKEDEESKKNERIMEALIRVSDVIRTQIQNFKVEI